MQPIISIIVPCYNGETYLRETLDCLQKQTIDNWECIIVNDGSTDGSLKIMKEYALKDSRYKYIDKKNEGVSIARNTAIAASIGKYILPLDPDDLIAPSYTQKAVKYLEEHDDVKLVYCECDMFGEIKGKLQLPNYSYTDLLWKCSIFCSCVYRRIDFDNTIGYNPNMVYMEEDYDFLISLLHEHDKVYKIPETLFFYRIRNKSRSNSKREKIPISHLQMVLNHPEVYSKYLDKSVKFINHDDYQRMYKRILSSKDYRIGHILLMPLRFLKRLF